MSRWVADTAKYFGATSLTLLLTLSFNAFFAFALLGTLQIVQAKEEHGHSVCLFFNSNTKYSHHCWYGYCDGKKKKIKFNCIWGIPEAFEERVKNCLLKPFRCIFIFFYGNSFIWRLIDWVFCSWVQFYF